jgi:hypothetical protein
MTFCAAFAKPVSAAPIKGKKIVEQPAIMKAVTIDGEVKNILALSDEAVQLEVRQDPLYGTVWDNGGVLIAIGIEADISGDYGDPIEADENGYIPGMQGAITTAVNDENGVAHQITLQGEPQENDVPIERDTP